MLLISFSGLDFFGLVCGLPFLLMAIALAGQTYYTYKRGYMFCGRTEIVAKNKNPRKYLLWFCLQLLGVLLFLMLSTFSLWT